MPHKLLVLLAIILWSGITLPLQKEASAETALNRAIVQNLRNLVRLIPQNRVSRPARVSDAMKPGDTLSTGRSSLVELRFNDGSLARIGEQAVFRFLAKTRNFKLSNGTVLLLIPPGRGVTGIQTPNAAAAIRGSALFVRYIPGTNTTIVGSLTDSNIEVFNEGGSQSEVLEAGQMAVIVEDRIESLYEFDLNTFYETSDLVQELDLNQQSKEESPDPAIASVQAETSEAAAAQPPIVGEGVVENPAFVQPSATSAPIPVDNTTSPTPVNPPVAAPINPPETPAANPQKTPVDNPVAPPTDDLPKIPVNNPVDPPTDDIPETPVDNPVDNPTDDIPETPVDDIPETPVDNPVDPPTDDIPETPVDDIPETPVDNPVDNPTDDIPETPVDNPVDNPVDPPTDDIPETPVDDIPETPVDDIPETPVDNPVDNPVDPPTEDIPETPVDNPVDPPIDPPTEDIPETPVDNPVDPPTEDIPETPVDNPVDPPVDPPTDDILVN